jgi:hypothetical protein
MTATGKSAKASLSTGEATCDKVCNNVVSVGNSNGRCIATVNVAFDRQFIEQSKGLDFFVHWKGGPVDIGRHLIDRENHQFIHGSKNHQLINVPARRLHKPEWHEVLYVDASAVDAIIHSQPLLLQCNSSRGRNRNRLTLSGGHHNGRGRGVAARVAQVEAGHEAAVEAEPTTTLVIKGLNPDRIRRLLRHAGEELERLRPDETESLTKVIRALNHANNEQNPTNANPDAACLPVAPAATTHAGNESQQ